LDSIAHYKILERVGESRLGEIFRARDTRLGRTVAIKIPPAAVQNDPVKRAALLADAQTAATLSHPTIAALYEAGEDNGRVFLACEFVPGDPLDRVIGGHALNPRRAIDLAAQLADALADAHAAGQAHGNLTSDAVVVTPKGNAKVLDFGFSRWTRPDGTAGGEAGDIRAVAGLLFEMLTGKAPAGDRVAPTAVNKSLPPEVDALALKDYGLAVTFAADLRAVGAILEVRAEAAGPSRARPVRGGARRRTGPWVALAVVLFAALAAAVWLLLRSALH
jgi:serine/threonine protein kinase